MGDILEEQGICDILVCGLVSHGYVRATCLGGVALGRRVLLLKDGHSNWAKDAGEKIDAVERELAAAGIEAIRHLGLTTRKPGGNVARYPKQFHSSR